MPSANPPPPRTPSIPHNNSLTNSSPDIRWSLDLRWQDAALPAGFWGIKNPILLKKAGCVRGFGHWVCACVLCGLHGMAIHQRGRPLIYVDIHLPTIGRPNAHATNRRDPTFEPDWAGFVAVDRGSAQSKAAHDGGAAVAVAQQDGKGGGPWARRVMCLWGLSAIRDADLTFAPRARTEGKGEEAAGLAAAEAGAAGAEDDFEPVIAGPWMLRWNIGTWPRPWP